MPDPADYDYETGNPNNQPAKIDGSEMPVLHKNPESYFHDIFLFRQAKIHAIIYNTQNNNVLYEISWLGCFNMCIIFVQYIIIFYIYTVNVVI